MKTNDILELSNQFYKLSFKNTKFYHSSPTLYKPGDYLIKNEGYGRRDVGAETLLERVRQEKFPHRPSRNGALFVILINQKGENQWVTKAEYLYEVDIEGDDWFLTDGEYFTNIILGNRHNAEYWAEKYWEGLQNVNQGSASEIVTHNKVRIVDGPYKLNAKYKKDFYMEQNPLKFDAVDYDQEVEIYKAKKQKQKEEERIRNLVREQPRKQAVKNLAEACSYVAVLAKIITSEQEIFKVAVAKIQKGISEFRSNKFISNDTLLEIFDKLSDVIYISESQGNSDKLIKEYTDKLISSYNVIYNNINLLARDIL